jgi:hypothetical protein
VTITGERANRIIEVHDGATRMGAADDNGQVIDGTSNTVAFGESGALFNIPALVTQMTITTFYTPANGQPVVCNTSGVVNLPSLASPQTIGDLLNAAGITLCPPLDNTLDTSGSPAEVENLDDLQRLLLTAIFGGGTHLEAANPDLPPDPLFNPLVLKEDCEGEGVGE